jgi:hypothetical protein
MVAKRKICRKTVKKTRKVKGRWGSPINRSLAGGSSISNPFKKGEESEEKRAERMLKRYEKKNVKAELKEELRQAKLQKLARITEDSKALIKARQAQRKARELHPLHRILSPTTKTKRGKIRWL